MNHRFLRLAGALLWCSTAMAATPTMAQSEAPARLDIPAQPLARAIAEYSRITGVLVVADASLTRGRTSAPVRGEYTSDAALAQLLSGTGLRAFPDGAGGFVLSQVRADREGDTEQQASNAVGPNVLAAAEIVVTGYRATQQRSATKTPLSLKDI